MLNRKILIIIIIVCAIGAGVLVFLVYNKKSPAVPAGNSQAEEKKQETSQAPAQVFLKASPNLEDQDGDGVKDSEEEKLGTSTSSFDSDYDGLSDGLEIKLGTDPNKRDTDGDGFSDGLEVVKDFNPLGPGKLE